MKLKYLASNENMLRYALIATLLVFGFLYNKASRVKMRTLTGQLNVHVKHLESGNDFVKSADVFIDANSRLNVLVTQREPILRIVNHEGYSLYVDKDGTTMPASLHYSPRVLVAYAKVPHTIDTLSLSKPGVQADLFSLTNIIREDRFLNTLIEQIATDNDGDWVLVPKLGPSKILIGNLESMDTKVEAIRKVYKKILPAEGWDKYSVINLKFKGQVICTKKT